MGGLLAGRTRAMAGLAVTFAREAAALAAELDRRTGRRTRALEAAVREAREAAARVDGFLILGNADEAHRWALTSMACAATALAEAKAALAQHDGVLAAGRLS